MLLSQTCKCYCHKLVNVMYMCYNISQTCKCYCKCYICHKLVNVIVNVIVTNL